jgi:hypothetical protein
MYKYKTENPSVHYNKPELFFCVQDFIIFVANKQVNFKYYDSWRK